jgi:phosphoenolpyruvate synthase/pyruvate phosphate dikinase
MEGNGLHDAVAAVLDDPRFSTDPAWTETRLAALREAIATAPLDRHLQAQLQAKVQASFGTSKVRFRSSTNCEDLPNFNGAGLYQSFTGRSGDPDRPLEVAVRQVWASLWTDAAVAERKFYRIDHRAVAMAVLVHPSFPEEEANGVALTINIFNPRRPGYFINVQEGEASVTNPGGGDVPDQFILYTWYEEPEVEYLSHSNLTSDGASVLSWSETLELMGALKAIHNHFAETYEIRPTDPEFGMDVEFKLVGAARDLVIKQARPIPR